MQRLIFAIILWALVPVANAASEPLTLSSYTNAEIHQATLLACQGVSRQDFDHSSLKLDDYKAGKTASPRFNEMLQVIYKESREAALDNFEFKNATTSGQWLVIQEPYKQALQTCYGKDQVMWSYFNKLVFQADMRGKIAVGAFHAASFVGFTKAVQWVYKGSKWVGHALAYGLPTLAAGAMVKDIIRDEKMKEAAQDKCKQQGVELDRCESTLFLEALESRVQKPLADEKEQVSNEDFFAGIVKKEIAKLKADLLASKDEVERKRIQDSLQKKENFLKSLSAKKSE